MAQLRFPVTKDGLVVPVWIGLSGRLTSALFAARRQIAPPVQATGLLDTASDVTAVAPWVLHQLAVPQAMMTSTHTASGQVKVSLFEVSLSILDPSVASSPWLTQSDLLVMELPSVLPNMDVLIGMDLLLQTNLFLEGPARQFSLVF
jgi:hypothetical protein